MGVQKPYHRNYRAMKESHNSGYNEIAYIRDENYAKAPVHYLRAFMIIQRDLEKIFEYIEPSESSLKAYSYRIHELLMRTCIEIEANFKAILAENLFIPEKNKYGQIYNIRVYKKVNKTHHLSSYEVSLPIWNGEKRILKPFHSWIEGKTPVWYQAYNNSKHDRLEKFKEANLENLIDAVAGLLALISSQFKTDDFSASVGFLSVRDVDYYDMGPAIGSFFRIRFPADWSDEEKYDFNWSELSKESDRFAKINYNQIDS
ncbi:hypothetical protein GCM10010909_03040 [Acidocella aquatica]|uniref:Uncharacterized protein n=1 Tax=Acidocella aquatica TaxID=1922313 RepID=A0ABQ6A420_9PROT|nr:hypothetical protein [Acidocella aquatica]GLR65626.1 hypothetical protein GCM10010909_03040 [Acidocella aquatica]